MASILLITQDQALQSYASDLLAAAGHQVTPADCGASAVAITLRVKVDVIVADSLLEGLDDLRRLIQIDVPYVFLAAGAALLPGRLPLHERDRVVTKPIAADDLRAAVAAALQLPGAPSPEVDLAGVTLDRAGQRLLSAGSSVQLTPIEFRLIDHLARAGGAIATTEDLLRDVWHYAPGTGSSEVIRSHLKNLRSKLRAITGDPDLIETVPRRGYRLALR